MIAMVFMRQALMALAEQTDCDVRSCLHTLQFLSRRTRTVRPADIDGARVGQKDVTKNAFAAWQELFWLRVGVLSPSLRTSD
jgi:chromosome transmission fidelity protein 18